MGKTLTRKTIRIAVTPMLQQDTNTVCSIGEFAGKSDHVKGGVVTLDSSRSYELSFEIQPGVDGLEVSFPGDPDEAFSCDPSCCPGENAPSSGGFLSDPQLPDSKTLTMRADPGSGKGMIFYRLNFDDGTNYDPIVIHD